MTTDAERLGLALGALGVIIFGGTLPATRLAVADLDFAFVTAGRAVCAGLIAGAALWIFRRPVPARADWPTLALASALLVWGFPLCTSFAMTLGSAGHGGVVLAVMPLATALAGAWLMGERPSGRFWIVSLIGAALVLTFVVWTGDSEADGLGPGDLALLGCIVTAAIGYALSARLTRRMAGWEVISWALVLSLPLSAPVAALTAPSDWTAIRLPSWAGFAYVAVMSQYLGFFAWNAGMALGGVARVSQIQLLQTFVTLALAAWVLGEPLEPITVAFAAAVVAVVALGRRAPIRHVSDAEPAPGPG